MTTKDFSETVQGTMAKTEGTPDAEKVRRRLSPRSVGKPVSRGDTPTQIDSEWVTITGINPTITTVCDATITVELADYVEAGLPLSNALDLAGVPEEVFRGWASKATLDEQPYVWALAMIKKAAAAYLYNNVTQLNDARGADYKKFLELLKLRDGDNWGGAGSLDLSEDDVSAEFL